MQVSPGDAIISLVNRAARSESLRKLHVLREEVSSGLVRYPWLFPSYAYAQTYPRLCITGYQRLSPVQPIVTALRAVREGLQFYYFGLIPISLYHLSK